MCCPIQLHDGSILVKARYCSAWVWDAEWIQGGKFTEDDLATIQDADHFISRRLVMIDLEQLCATGASFSLAHDLPRITVSTVSTDSPCSAKAKKP
jgi:hypothetical protein